MNKILKGILGGFLGLTCAYIIVKYDGYIEKPTMVRQSKIEKKVLLTDENIVKKLSCLGQSKCKEKNLDKTETKAQLNYKISKKLNSMIGNDRLFDLEKETLGKVLKEEIRSSFISANYILQQQKEYEFAFKQAENFETKLLQEFLYSYSYPVVIEEANNRELRNRLIKKYIENKKQMQLIHTIGALNQISFESHEVIEIKKSFCSLKLPKRNEAQIALYYKFDNFLAKYGEKKC